MSDEVYPSISTRDAHDAQDDAELRAWAATLPEGRVVVAMLDELSRQGQSGVAGAVFLYNLSHHGDTVVVGLDGEVDLLELARAAMAALTPPPN
jgi:hypothetical protein